MSTKTYTTGTHRTLDPRHTLTRVQPHLLDLGITRCADITGLDTPGIPVYCAIRPTGRTIQLSNGKGVRRVDAQVSALMEAIETHHAEHPLPHTLHRASRSGLLAHGHDVVNPASLASFRPEVFHSPHYQIDWMRGTNLHTGDDIWVPASAVHLSWPAPCEFSSNGLASGNDLTEATAHALYELLERDALARLRRDGAIRINDHCRVLDQTSITDPVVTDLTDAITRAGLTPVLLTVPTLAPVTTCWAAILDPDPLAPCTAINFGFGAHLSPGIAASRALTEAAQTRLTFIHGSRDDIRAGLYTQTRTSSRLRHSFSQLRPNQHWNELTDHATPTLDSDLKVLLEIGRASCRERV